MPIPFRLIPPSIHPIPPYPPSPTFFCGILLHAWYPGWVRPQGHPRHRGPAGIHSRQALPAQFNCASLPIHLHRPRQNFSVAFCRMVAMHRTHNLRHSAAWSVFVSHKCCGILLHARFHTHPRQAFPQPFNGPARPNPTAIFCGILLQGCLSRSHLAFMPLARSPAIHGRDVAIPRHSAARLLLLPPLPRTGEGARGGGPLPRPQTGRIPTACAGILHSKRPRLLAPPPSRAFE